MNQDPDRPLLDHWLWEPPMLRAFVTAAIVIPVFASGVLLLIVGLKGLYALVFAGFGPIFGLGYGFVGKKIARLREAVPAGDNMVLPASIVRGKIEAAGIVVLDDAVLTFQPVVGKRSATKRCEILSVKEVSVFNGSVLWGKTGFWFSTPDESRLGCAVPKSCADRFRQWLAADGKKVP